MLRFSSLEPVATRNRPAWWRRFLRVVRWRLPARIAIHRILSGPLRGMKIVTSWRDYPAAIAGITEPRLLQWFGQNAFAGETWLDVGAHYGYTSLALARRVGPAGRVFAFEPMAATVGCLARTRVANGLDSIIIVPVALGTGGDMKLEKLATTRGMVDSTLDRDVDDAKSWSELILVARLDWLWPLLSAEGKDIHGIKIDVQGMEMQALTGMQETLKTYRPKLVIEFHRGVDRAPILDLLSRCGYSPAAIPVEPVEGETAAQFVDDRSYSFLPGHAN